jgi:hypothetical protein
LTVPYIWPGPGVSISLKLASLRTLRLPMFFFL